MQGNFWKFSLSEKALKGVARRTQGKNVTEIDNQKPINLIDLMWNQQTSEDTEYNLFRLQVHSFIV